jgi:hypothetical protein
MNVFSMALANAPGLRESQLREIVRSGVPPHANVLFFCANDAAVDVWERATSGRFCPRLAAPGVSARESLA